MNKTIKINESVKWEPRELNDLAWENTVKNRPTFTVDTINKNGKDRTVTLVNCSNNYWEIIIDGVHHSATSFNIMAVLGLYFPINAVLRFEHVLMHNKKLNQH